MMCIHGEMQDEHVILLRLRAFEDDTAKSTTLYRRILQEMKTILKKSNILVMRE